MNTNINENVINTRRNNRIIKHNDAVYKVFNEGYSKEDVFAEAFFTSKIEGLKVGAPSIEQVTTINGQWAFMYPDIYGESLYTLMMNNPDKLDEYMDKLIKIQTNIHSKKCPYLPIQKQKLTDYINSAHLDRYLKLDLLDMLNSSPKHKKLCHGNLTPHNIIIKDDNIYVTDWNHASQGNASADVARTYLWMLINMPDYAENYLERFCNETNTSSKYVHNWIPIVAAAICAKNIQEEVKILNGLISVKEY